jgi:hypothetical protein
MEDYNFTQCVQVKVALSFWRVKERLKVYVLCFCIVITELERLKLQRSEIGATITLSNTPLK